MLRGKEIKGSDNDAHLDKIEAVLVVVIVTGVVGWCDFSFWLGQRLHASRGLRGSTVILAQISAETRRAHAVAVRTLVAAVLARQIARAVGVALVDDVGEIDVGEAKTLAVSKAGHVEGVDGGDGWLAITRETLFKWQLNKSFLIQNSPNIVCGTLRFLKSRIYM